MSFLKKIKSAIINIFKKAEKVEVEVVSTLEEKVSEVKEVIQKTSEVKEVIQKTSDVVDGFEIYHDKLEKYIDLFIDIILWKYTTSGKAVDLFAKEFTKVLNPVYKRVARKVKDELNIDQSNDPNDDTEYMKKLADKAIHSRKISQHIRRRVLIHIIEKLTPDSIEERIKSLYFK